MNWLKKLFGSDSSKPTQVPSVATLKKEAGNIFVLRIGGKLNKATVDHIQAFAAREIERGTTDLKVLLVLADFTGWKGGDNWGDINFFIQYEANISKIAVVGEPRWEAETLAFLGAGRRTGQVKFFKAGLEIQARAWLAEP
jgi:hypothetical protein